jgi:hypothetical protein
MRAVFGGSVAGATRIGGQELQRVPAAELPERKQSERPDRNVRRINGERIAFADLARFAWPNKTEFHLAHITRVDPRTCRRWLAGDNEPPAEALGVVLCEIMRRFHQRD